MHNTPASDPATGSANLNRDRGLRHMPIGWLAPLAVLAISVFSAGASVRTASTEQSARWDHADGHTTPAVALAERTQAAWAGARTGDWAAVAMALSDLPEVAGGTSLQIAVNRLQANLHQREVSRSEEAGRVEKDLAAALEEAHGEKEGIKLSEALRSAVELHMLTPPSKRPELVASGRYQALIQRAATAAHRAEADGQWIIANELFARLNALLETEATYKADSRRLTERLNMIRLYVPQRFWELRNERRILDGQSPLPPFNPIGEDFNQKLRGVDASVVARAIGQAVRQHVERVPLRDLLIGGFESVRTMASTPDLNPAFPGLNDPKARQDMVNFIDTQIASVRMERNDFRLNVAVHLERLLDYNRTSTRILEAALLHEFGNGAFSKLDEFSQIIWPDELARFRRMTEGSFVGVGIQIQLDDESQMIRVVTPIEGTPAQRAGVRAGDLIKKINNVSAVGMTLDQAVEQITGRPGTDVTLTLERDKDDIAFNLTRERIPIRTVRGWQRTGPADTDWNWFIDRDQRIGYVRLTQFNDSTTDDLHAALTAMKSQGVRGLILDLRFNPGGLLDQAIKVANTFVDAGTLVYTEGAGGVRRQTEVADPDQVRAKGLPLVVLINEGSASASEIVSGAIRHYADQGKINAVVIGERTFGKGSVQNVMPLPPSTQMKLTTQYYFVPSGQIIHRRPNATAWGVDPHLRVEMLPKQISDALLLRQDADLPPDTKPFPRPTTGRRGEKREDRPKDEPFPPNPARLLTEGLDLQLESALVLLQARTVGQTAIAGGHAEPETVKNPG